MSFDRDRYAGVAIERRDTQEMWDMIDENIKTYGEWYAEVVVKENESTEPRVMGTKAFQIIPIVLGDPDKVLSPSRHAINRLSENIGLIAHFYFGGSLAETKFYLDETEIYIIEVTIWCRKVGLERRFIRMFNVTFSNAMYSPAPYESNQSERFLQADNKGMKLNVIFDKEEYESGYKRFLVRNVSFMVTESMAQKLMARERLIVTANDKEYQPLGVQINQRSS